MVQFSHLGLTLAWFLGPRYGPASPGGCATPQCATPAEFPGHEQPREATLTPGTPRAGLLTFGVRAVHGGDRVHAAGTAPRMTSTSSSRVGPGAYAGRQPSW